MAAAERKRLPEVGVTSEEVLARLRRTPQRLADLTAEIPAQRLRSQPEPEAWSAVEVLAHLRACADVWGDCIATMLAHDHPTLRAVNPRSWIRRTDYRELEFAASLDAFTAQREGLLGILEPLAPEAWARPATITGAGAALERTVLSYGRWMASHERPHITQIERILGGRVSTAPRARRAPG